MGKQLSHTNNINKFNCQIAEQVFELSPLAILLFNTDFQLIQQNASARKIVKPKAVQPANYSFTDIFYRFYYVNSNPEYRGFDDLERNVKQSFKHSDIKLFTIHVHLKCPENGSFKDEVVLKFQFQRMKVSQAEYFLLSLENITDIESIESKLYSLQNQYSGFIDTAMDTVMHWKVPDRLETSLPIEKQVDLLLDAVCIDINQIGVLNMGLEKKKELIGKKYREILSAEHFTHLLKTFVTNGYSLESKAIYGFLNNKQWVGKLNLHGVIKNNQLLSMWLTTKDVTNEKKSEAKLKETNVKLKQLNERLFQINEKSAITEKKLRERNKELQNSNLKLEEQNKKLETLNKELSLAKKETEMYQTRLRLAMEATNDGLWDWNIRTNEVYYSPRWKEMLGYKDHEIGDTPTEWEKLSDPEEVKRIYKIHEEALIGKKNKIEVEFKMRHKKGHWVDILSRASIFFDEKQRAIRTIGTHIDISKRKRIEEKLAESENRFKMLFENMHEGVSIYKPTEDGENFIVLDLNQNAEKIMNISKKEVVGKLLLDVFPNISKSPLYKGLIDVHRTGQPVCIPPFYYEDTNQEGWRENHLYQLPSKEIVVIFSDVSESINVSKKQKEQNLQLKTINRKLLESETRYRMLAENIPLVTYLRKNDENWTLLYLSERIESLTGYPLDLFISGIISFPTLFHPEDTNTIYLELEEALRKKTPFLLTYRLRHKTGHWKWMEEHGVAFNDSNGELVVEGTIQDISERLKTELQLKEAIAKAKQSDELKTAFLQNMSHEIRTPMNGIVGFSEMLTQPDITEDKKEYFIKLIGHSSNQLLNIVNDILDISRIETGQVDFHEMEVDLQNFCSALYDMYSFHAREKRLDFEVKQEIHNQFRYAVFDKQKIEQIFNNLISNALKFTDSGKIEVGCKTEAKKITFYVSDTGIGINPLQHQQIFERFSKVETTQNRKYSGTGLGLAICKGIIEQMGGEIWVESETGKGASFFFWLPFIGLSRPNRLSTPLVNKEVKATEAIILVAEDEEMNYLYIAEVLEILKLKTIHARNGLEAISICKKEPRIDLVLMDIKMPKLDGYDATKEIKSFRPNLPIIALTAFALNEDKQKAFLAGCDDYLAKPVKLEQVMSIIAKFTGA